jgi:sec-independent protein translocase protein TatC
MTEITSPQSTALPPKEELEEETGGQMTLLEHLEELRSRLVKVAIAIGIATAISFAFAQQFVDFLAVPIGGLDKLQAIDVTENISVFMQVSLIGGLVLAMPVIVYQLIRFIVPGLTDDEKRYLWIVVPTASLLFVVGVAFAFFVMLPNAVPFLTSFLNIPTKPRPETYFGFITKLMFWIGVSFQTPLILAFLARLGIITPQLLIKYRRYAIVLMAILAAVITPTVDPVNMMLVMAPLVILYELGILLSRFTYRKRQG